jgi:tetratricopeptide (TPR) repeat protein
LEVKKILHGGYQTKEGKTLRILLGLIILLVAIIVLINFSERKQYETQVAEAEEYLQTGNYEKAVGSYLNAMSMKGSELKQLTIGLTDAYLGLNDYDKALEALRSRYQKSSEMEIKEKIEEVTSAKTEYEYLQSISRADVYFLNEEYDRAIIEYEKAKEIKNDEITSYQKIAEAYVKQGKYDLAREEVLEGQELTQNELLEDTLAMVDYHLHEEQYESILAEAKDFICQENYEDGIAKYQEAIALLPKEAEAYNGIAEVYLTRKDYEQAAVFLRNAVKTVKSGLLEDLLQEADQLKQEEDDKEKLLLNLYQAFENADYNTVIEIMNMDLFTKTIVKDPPIYYNIGIQDQVNKEMMIIVDSENVYYGRIESGIRKGIGTYFTVTRDDSAKEYYYYEGEWSNGIPNGVGKTVEVATVLGEDSVSYVSQTVTEGTYYNALENGTMYKLFYANGAETQKVKYRAAQGIPMPMAELYSRITSSSEEEYAIGTIEKGDIKTEELYYVKPYTLWGVTSFMIDK